MTLEPAPETQKSDELEWNNVPNQLTLARVVLVPAVIALLAWRTQLTDIGAAIIFGAASITDYFDGYYARTRKLITVFGKLMDPLADKFLVVCSLIMLQELGRIHPFIVMVLVCREFAITGLRAVASSEGFVIDASSGGKWKTATQMVAIPFLMIEEPLFDLIPLFELGQVLLAISVALSLWSAKDYVFGFFKAMGAKRLENRARKLRLKEAKKLRRLAKRQRNQERLK